MNKIDLQLFADDFLANYNVKFEINTTPETTETWEELGEGFDNLSESLNEVVQDYQFLNGGGYGKSFVTGMQPVMTLTGVRMRQDTAQNYIFGKKYEIGETRVTDLKITVEDVGSATSTEILFEDVVIANLVEYGGNSTDGSAISVEFKSSGKPTITTTP